MDAVYPHTPIISRMSPFPDGGQGKAVAGLTLIYGPIVIRAKLVKNEQGGLFLSMPSRKNEQNSTWYEMASIQDRTLYDAVERMAIVSYRDKTSELALSA
jgi:DNA-binding cell septation regulator SpoVG